MTVPILIMILSFVVVAWSGIILFKQYKHNKRLEDKIIFGPTEIMNLLSEGLDSEKHKDQTKDIINDLIKLRDDIKDDV